MSLPQLNNEDEVQINFENGENVTLSHPIQVEIVVPTRRRGRSAEQANSAGYEYGKREKKEEIIDEKSQEENGEDSAYENSDVDESEEEVFRSDDEPDEEVNETVKRLRERWAAQARENALVTQQAQLAHQTLALASVPRPLPVNTKEVFSFDIHFPHLTIWPEGVPPAQKMDMSRFVRDANLIKDGQPEYITQPPSKLNYVLANQNLEHIRHHRADLYPNYFKRAMVAYAVDPYFYIDVGAPPPADLHIPPLPSHFFDSHPRVPDELVNPGPNDPIIPIFYKRRKW